MPLGVQWYNQQDILRRYYVAILISYPIMISTRDSHISPRSGGRGAISHGLEFEIVELYFHTLPLTWSGTHYLTLVTLSLLLDRAVGALVMTFEIFITLKIENYII